jgi:hypothetical protein
MWKMILTDLYGTVLGPVLNAHDRVFTFPHLGIPTAQFRLKIDHPRVQDLLTEDTLLKVYRGSTLTFNGPVTVVNEIGSADANSVAVVASSPLWRLQKRMLGKHKAGFAYGTGTELLDRSDIIRRILNEVNAVPAEYTGISVGTITASSPSAIGPEHFKPALEAIIEISATVNGAEFRVRPTEPTTVPGGGGWPQLGLLDAVPLLGAERPDVLFQYGTTRANVESYERSRSLDGVANRVYHMPPGWPDGTLQDFIMRQDATSQTDRGLYEDKVEADISSSTLREQLLDLHLQVRKAHREVVTFKPVTNARPAPIQDYDVGDQIRARAVVSGQTRFDAMFRVWGITVTLDPNGNESTDLELIQQ